MTPSCPYLRSLFYSVRVTIYGLYFIACHDRPARLVDPGRTPALRILAITGGDQERPAVHLTVPSGRSWSLFYSVRVTIYGLYFINVRVRIYGLHFINVRVPIYGLYFIGIMSLYSPIKKSGQCRTMMGKGWTSIMSLLITVVIAIIKSDNVPILQ